MNRWPEQQHMIDFLEPRSVDQPRDISEHRQQDDWQEQQAPR